MIQIRVNDRISDSDAVKCVWNVIEMGKVSENNTKYCYVTKFNTGIIVYADESKAKNLLFTVYREDVTA